MSEWIMDAIEWLCDGPGAILALVVILGVLIFALFKDEQNWERFAADHHCHVIRETAGQTIVSLDGKTAYLSGTKTWLCDDGKEYTR